MNRYTANGKRRSSMAHANTMHYFDCGRTIAGNAASRHRASHGCRELTFTQWIDYYALHGLALAALEPDR